MRNITMILEAWRRGREGSWERIEAEGLKRPAGIDERGWV